MTDDPLDYVLTPQPPQPATFDYSTYEWLIAESQRIDALYGPRPTRISGCAPLLHWFLRNIPHAEPGATPIPLFGQVAVVVDDEVPMDSLRMTYADGTHKDIRVIEPPGDDWPRMDGPYLQPPDGLRAQLQRESMLGRPLLHDPDRTMGERP